MMGRGTHVDMNQQVEEIQIEQAEESIDSNPTEMIQLVCAGCMRPFESENHFQAHICTGQATADSQGQAAVTSGQTVFGPDHQIILQTAGSGADNTIVTDQLVTQTFANSLNLTSHEFTEQLVRAVAQAAGSGGPGQVTVSIAPNGKLDEGGAVSVSIPEFDDSTGSAVLPEEAAAVFTQDENTNSMMSAHQLVEAVEQARLQIQANELCSAEQGSESILIQKDGEENTMVQEATECTNLLEHAKDETQQSSEQSVFAVDSDNQQVLVSVEEHLPVENQSNLDFQNEHSQPDATEEFVAHISLGRNKNDANSENIQSENETSLKPELELGQLEGEDSQNAQIVMMVSDDQDGEPQQVPIQIPGDQSYTSAAVLKIPTADGGHQMLIIPINSNESGNAVLTLPQGFTLGGEDSGDGNITLALDPGTMSLD
ncbi:hypothetical protein X975_25447, partial [Stegodyphus mimosarum]